MSEPEFPPELRDLPEVAAREIYIHQLISKRPASIFFREFEQREKEDARKNEGITEIEFRFVDAVYFFAQAAAVGVIGNLAYSAIPPLVRAIRKPISEISDGGVNFELVISRKTYERVRKEQHGSKRAKRASSTLKNELTKTYSLMVNRKKPRKLT